MRARSGFLMMLALMLCTLLLVVVLGFLGTRSLEFSSTSRVQARAQAQALAEAGMEDVRVKLEKDLFFPPLAGYGQSTYTFSEDVTDPDSGQLIGIYTVSVDTSKKQGPYSLIKLLSVGSAGPRDRPRSRYRIYAELDIASTDRASNSGPNPNLYRYLDWREGEVEAPGIALPMPE